MENEQVQQQGAAAQPQAGAQVNPQPQQAAMDPALQQMQQMLHQLAMDQQAMWQHMQAWQRTVNPPPAQPQAAHPGPPPQAEACEHHAPDPQQQAEHFLRMAEKFSRGDMNATDVAGGLSLLNTQNGSFWKGALIGGGLTLLISNEGIREALTGMFKTEEKA